MQNTMVFNIPDYQDVSVLNVTDIYNICRACLQTNLKEKKSLQSSSGYAQLFVSCTRIEINHEDGMPQQICSSCSDILDSFSAFREQCRSSDAALKITLLAESIKKEIGVEIKEDIKVEAEEDLTTGTSEKDELILNEVKDEYESDGVSNEDINIEESFSEQSLKIKSPCNIQSKATCGKIKRTGKDATKTLLNHKPPSSNEIVENKPDKHNCGLCHQVFLSHEDVREHLSSHESGMSCRVCYVRLTDKAQLLIHRYEHLTNQSAFPCTLCPVKCKSIHTIEFHIRKAHFGEKEVSCQLCRKKHSTPVSHSKHMRSQHANKIFICDICKRSYCSKNGLVTHMATHQPRKWFPCNICKYQTLSRACLKVHTMRKHSEHEGLPCPKCPKTFANLPRLRCHITSAHPNQIGICPTCGKTFRNAHSLKRHLKSHSNVKPYVCPECGLKFAGHGGLRDHLNRHRGVKPHKCKFCPLESYTKSVMIKHQRVHTGEKPYVCQLCGKAFTGNHNLKVHMKVHGMELVVKKSANVELLSTTDASQNVFG